MCFRSLTLLSQVDSPDTAKKSEGPKNEKSISSPKITEANPPQTSESAFASSGFASLASSSTSGFGSLGASKPSLFGGGASSTSGFGSLAKSGSATSTTTAPAPSGFGSLASKPSSGFGFGTGASSGFGGRASGSVFGSKLSNGFAGGSGPKLSSFAAPGKEAAPLGSKPAKAFGAPESDEEDGSEDEVSYIIIPCSAQYQEPNSEDLILEPSQYSELKRHTLRARKFSTENVPTKLTHSTGQ